MDLLLLLNPLIVFRKYVRVPVEAFIIRQYLDYKERTNKGISSVKDLLCRAGIVVLFSTAILWISVFMYVVFYYTYMPNVAHVRPVHLQFKSCESGTGVCSFPSAHVQLTRRSSVLMPAQPYRVRLALDMPESPPNKQLGMFMVCAQMRAKGGVLVSSSCRSAMLRHRFPKGMHLKPLNDEQMDILLHFADRCRHLCFGRPPKGRDDQIIAYKEWKEFARDMNYACDDPPVSDLEWRAYWMELKKRIKAKAYQQKRKTTTKNAPKASKLTPFEEHIMELAEIAAREAKRPKVIKASSDSMESDDDESSLPPCEEQENGTNNISIPEQGDESRNNNRPPSVSESETTEAKQDASPTIKQSSSPVNIPDSNTEATNSTAQRAREHANKLSEAISLLAASYKAMADSNMAVAESNRAIAAALGSFSGNINLRMGVE